MPRKVFVAGEILTAADVNTNLMDQAVMSFAGTAARGSAIPSPVEGMVTYLEDSDSVQVWKGSAWGSVGGLIAVKSALKTDTETISSIAAGASANVTGLSITHEVSDPANKLIISAFFGTTNTSRQRGNTGIAVAVDGTMIQIGDTAGNRTRVSAGGWGVSVDSGDYAVNPSITVVYTPGAGSKTYTVRAINISENTDNIFINRSQNDTDNVRFSRAVSSLIIQEVAV